MQNQTEEHFFMPSNRTRIRAITTVGAAGVVVALGSVTYNASAAETSSSAAARPAAAGVQNVRPPAESLIPANIRPPAGSKLVGAEIVVSGTQTYTCKVTAPATEGTYVGTSSTPEAKLAGTLGFVHHFAGPTWQAQPPVDNSSSKITAGRVDGVDKPGTIPWLLLKVNSSSGTGALAKTQYIQRLATSGGAAPTDACTDGQKVSVPYGAIYVFWG
jgi:hypothetical protein